jgi:pimeloyl-ACP methyl ester carboxylesterase
MSFIQELIRSSFIKNYYDKMFIMVIKEGLHPQPLYETQTVTIESSTGNLTVSANYRKGNERLILFLHGLGGTKDAFKNVWDRDELREESILVPDLQGFGESSHNPTFSYTLEDQVEVLKKLLSKYPYEELHIVAHSMGGAIGVLLAEQIPNLGSFVDIDGNLIPGDGGLLSRQTAGLPYEEFRNQKFEQLRNQMSQSSSVGAREWVDQSRQADPLGFYRSARSLVKWSDSGELLERYNALSARKLFVFGESNNGMNVLSRLDPNETLMIGQSDHFPMNDAPNEFYPKLASFIHNGR